MRAVRQLVLLTTAVAVLAAVPGRVQAEAIDFDRDIAPIFEERCWHCHGEDEAESGLRLDRRSRVLLEDAMIAATAEVRGLIVVTRNVRDFAALGVRTLNPFRHPLEGG